MRVSREQLYKEVWAEPMTTVAKRYEVSSNYLARICESLNVPRPGRGYWAQRASGLDVETEPLPEAQPGDEIEWVRDGTRPATAPMSAGSPRRGPRPDKHPLLFGAGADFDEVRNRREVMYVLPRKSKLVDIFVTRSTVPRALKVASDLFLFLEDRGQRVVLAPHGQGYSRPDLDVREGANERHDYGDYDRGHWQPVTPTVTLVGDIAIGLTLYETVEEVDSVYRDGKRGRYEPPKTLPKRGSRWVQQEYVSKHWLPSGRLGLHAYAARRVEWEHTWIEKAPGDLPKLFDEIAKALESAVPKITKLLAEQAKENERRRKEFEEQQKRWRREAEERQRKEEEAARVKRLQETMVSWRMARDIRAYVAEIHDLVKAAGLQVIENSGADEELKWALSYADQIDPLTSWRKDIEKVKAEAPEPCPKCGKVHGAAEAEASANESAPDPLLP